jgi:hypothetical protein
MLDRKALSAKEHRLGIAASRQDLPRGKSESCASTCPGAAQKRLLRLLFQHRSKSSDRIFPEVGGGGQSVRALHASGWRIGSAGFAARHKASNT